MAGYKSALSKLALLLVGSIIALAVLEIGSRLVLGTTKLGRKIQYVEDRLKSYKYLIHASDPDLGWGYKPDTNEDFTSSDFSITYSINSDGFRDKETSADARAGKFVVLALGESTVFGEGLNYGSRFTEVIESSLSDTEVINMGVWGFGADQSLLQLEKYGFRFRPRCVILFVIPHYLERCKLYQHLKSAKPRFVLNDRKDGLVFQDLAFVKSNFALAAPQKKPWESFLEGSGFVTLLEGRKRILENDLAIDRVDKNYWEGVYKRQQEDRRKGIRYSGRDFKKLLSLILKRYQQVCRSHSADFLLVYMDTDKAYFSRWLAGPVRELKIDCLDLSGALNQASKKHSLRFNVDPHYNGFAHQVIGEQVAGYLAKKYHRQKK